MSRRDPQPREQLRISGKTLGELAVGSFCPRCFWLKLKMRNRLPFQIFPGIFSSIDSYTKQVVHARFDRHQAMPEWLAGLGDIAGYIEPPHWQQFNAVIDRHNILLTGVPDGLFVRPDESLLIVDYKTARFTTAQDELLPMYEVQLNAYALIAEACGLGRVSGFALIYMEPMTDSTVDFNAHCNDIRFSMGFSAHVREVNLDKDQLEPLLAKARELGDRSTPATGRAGCPDCDKARQVASLLASQATETCPH